ncbi:MAG TPA: hypothetical protein VJ485_01745 [archaeon]|nr:hypothetical protein [archaeon]
MVDLAVTQALFSQIKKHRESRDFILNKIYDLTREGKLQRNNYLSYLGNLMNLDILEQRDTEKYMDVFGYEPVDMGIIRFWISRN